MARVGVRARVRARVAAACPPWAHLGSRLRSAAVPTSVASQQGLLAAAERAGPTTARGALPRAHVGPGGSRTELGPPEPRSAAVETLCAAAACQLPPVTAPLSRLQPPTLHPIYPPPPPPRTTSGRTGSHGARRVRTGGAPAPSRPRSHGAGAAGPRLASCGCASTTSAERHPSYRMPHMARTPD